MKNENTAKKRTWVEIIPYGIVGGMVPNASTMIFKKKNGTERFVVWFSELQSRIAIDQNLNKEKVFDFVRKILEVSGIFPKYCFFLKTDRGRDIVKLSFNNHLKPIQFYADEVISFCMVNNCRFFCKDEFFRQTREEVPKRFQKQVLYDKPVYLN